MNHYSKFKNFFNSPKSQNNAALISTLRQSTSMINEAKIGRALSLSVGTEIVFNFGNEKEARTSPTHQILSLSQNIFSIFPPNFSFGASDDFSSIILLRFE